MLVVDESTTRELLATLDMREAIPHLAESFRAISGGATLALRGDVQLPERSARGLLLASYVGPLDGVCFKVTGTWNGRAGGLILVFDTTTGRPEAMLSGAYFSDFRTGAASGVATERLARRDSRCLAVLGTGKQASTQLQGALAVRPLEAVRVWNRTPTNAMAWIERMRGLPWAAALRFQLCATPEEACAGADVVTIATRAQEPILRGEWLGPGTHVNAVGAGSPLHRELHESLFQQAEVKTVDCRELALKVGDFTEPLERGLIRPEEFAELGEVLNGTRPGRTDGRQITLFKSVGHAANDLVVARLLARRAAELGQGVVVEI